VPPTSTGGYGLVHIENTSALDARQVEPSYLTRVK
jgi:hypothetical protein